MSYEFQKFSSFFKNVSNKVLEMSDSSRGKFQGQQVCTSFQTGRNLLTEVQFGCETYFKIWFQLTNNRYCSRTVISVMP